MAKALLKAMQDPSLFAPFFRDAATWQAWRTVLKVLFGTKLTAPELALFQRATGRTQPFRGAIREAWLVCGRRSGKSFIAALIAVYLSAFRDYTASLAPGERGVVLVLAVNRDQARVIFRYIEAFFDQVPILAKLVVSRTAETIELSNRVIIEVGTASYRSVRGRTVVAALCDEIAFWRDETSANPDKEILDALRPAMATISEPLLLTLSSPYARRGVLFEAVQRHHGNDESEVLVWKADTQTMNPTINPKTIRDAYEQDPLAAAAEWGADFRSDVAAFLEEAWITAALDKVHERSPTPTFRYWAFVDPSGGKRDSFTLAIAHQEKPTLILDLVREFRAPLNPDQVVAEIAGLLRPYRCTSVTGDRYAGEWVAQAFKQRGIRYDCADLTRSEIYLECGPWLAQGRIRLVDSPRLTVQLRQLERRTSILGKDAVNHPPGGSDDVANAAMGALWKAATSSVRLVPTGPRLAITDYNEFSHHEHIDNRSTPRRSPWQ
jgi:hypothetical protein